MIKDLVLNEFKGMHRLSSRLNMPTGYAWDIHNGYIKKDIKTGLGVIKQRNGITKFNSVALQSVVPTELDYMEYASNSAAQAAYPTNANGYYNSPVKLLINFNGSDGATTHTAETGQTVTFSGSAQLDTAQKKFGTASLLCGVASDKTTIPDSDDFTFGTGDFTIDCWLRFSDLTSSSGNSAIFSMRIDGDNNCGFYLYNNAGGNKYIYFRIESNNTTTHDYLGSIDTKCLITANIDTWYHFAFVRTGNVIKMFQNGAQVGTDISCSFDYPNYTTAPVVWEAAAIKGWMDSIRISKGLARWTTNFTPPTSELDYYDGYYLNSFSESTIKNQGTYSLKGIALITQSLNKTLTRTLSTSLDLSNVDSIKFDIYASRTGSNIKIGIHDSGGTTTEITPNITAANTWQTVTWDISAVANANKDAIDSIIITIVNADADNTFYVDNMLYNAPAFGSNTEIKYIFEAKWKGLSTDILIRAGTAWGIFDGVDTFDPLDVARIDGNRGQAVMFNNEIIMADGGYLRKCKSDYTVSNLLPVGGVKTVSINTQGIGYYVGDVLTLVQAGGEDATVTVTAVDDFGAILDTEVTDAGKGYTAATGLTTTLGQDSGAIRTITLGSGGSGYVVGDILTITGGTGGTAKVTTVSSGVITAIALITAGHNYSTDNGLATTSNNNGTGATINVTATGGTGGKITILTLCDDDQPIHVSKVHVHGHKVWCNDDDNPMQARYLKTDAANQADSFLKENDAGILDFSTILPNGDKLLGFVTFAEVFLVFIFTGYAVVYQAGADPTQFAIQQIIPLNCVSGHAVKQIGNDLAICSSEGLNSFKSSQANQDLDTDDLSKNIAPLYKELIDSINNKEDISTGYSHSLNHLYIGIPSLEPTILVYSPEAQNFIGRWTGIECNSFCEKLDKTMLIGGDGYVYKMNTGLNDDGEAINFSYDFGALYANSGGQNKAFRQIEGLITHEGNPKLNIDYSYITIGLSAIKYPLDLNFSGGGVDWNSDEAIWNEASWNGSVSERFLSSGMLGRGKALLLSLSNYVLDSNLEIEYLILRYRKEGIKIR